MYEKFSSGSSWFMMYGENIAKVTRETFMKSANRLLETALDSNTVRVALNAFYAMRCVNDERYLPMDKVPVVGKLQKKQKNSVLFYQTDTPFIATFSRSYKLLAVGIAKPEVR